MRKRGDLSVKKRIAPFILAAFFLIALAFVPAKATQTDYLTFEEAVPVVRQGLKNWDTDVTVQVQSDTELSSNACSDLYERAIAHTGVPDEGDYLRRNMSGCYFSTEYTVIDGIYYYTFTISPNWLCTQAQAREVDAAVDALLAELNLWNEDEYGKIVGVYNWITENVQYDFDNLDDDTYTLKYSTYSALIQRNTVCQGYATLLYRLMLSLGVDCRLISGVSDGENHAWNIVLLEGKYYNVDATWDRDLMGHYRNFLCTEANFGDHTRNAEFDTAAFHNQYPMATEPYVHNVAASGTIRPGMTWVLNGDDGTLTVTGTGAIPSYRFNKAPWYDYRESIRSIVISEGITEVGERAFYWSTNCTSVTLPSTLTAIREYGFNNLRALQQITLPENLKIIEFCAFSECPGLKSIVLPDSVTTVGPSAFSNCPGLTSAKLSAGMRSVPSSMFFNDPKLQTVVIPEGITSIENTAFSSTGLRSFHFPASLTQLGSSVFGGCTRLREFTVAADNPSFKAVNGVLFSKDGKTLLSYPAGKYGSYTIPEGTEIIASSAFRSANSLTSINFGTTLREIGDYSFSYCTGLYSVTFPKNVTKICDSAFRSCTYLRNVTFENQSVTLESGGVFAECDSLVSITLPTNLSEVPGYLFYGCAKLKNVTIPSTARSIGSSAFLDCDSLVSIVIPGNVKTVGRQAFDYCNMLQTVIIQEGVTKLEDYCFRNAPNLTRVLIPDSVTSIGRENFDTCPYVTVVANCGTTAHNYAVNKRLDYEISHPRNFTKTYAPTCLDQGYTYSGCRCGMSGEKFDYVPAIGHDWYADVYPPDCYSGGYTFYFCQNCGDCYEDDFTPPTDHVYGDIYVISEPTCTQAGTGWHECIYCYTMEYVDIPATGHTPGESVRENEEPDGSHDLVTYCDTCSQELSREHISGHVPGDITGDGIVNNKDLTRLFRYLSGYEVEVNEKALDITGDGSVNNKDLTRLFRFLSGHEVMIY